jgi:hypothetical protein
MKKQLFYFSFGIMFLIINIQNLSGQFSRVQETMAFGYRFNAPVEMDVTKSSDRVSFNVNNKSYFPYELTISFTSLQNLLPRVFEHKYTVTTGYNTLFILNVADKEQQVQYEYSISYNIKLSENPDISFPYLVPIGNGRIVRLDSKKNEKGETFLINYFKMDKKDTVFAIRKGTVTALPDNGTEVERIFKTASLEILHGDGTVAIYRGLDPSLKSVRLGQTVYPGQPIGIMDATTLILTLVAMPAKSILKQVDVFYSDQNGNPVSQDIINGKKVFFPIEIIKKELTGKEIKKFEKGNLY